MKFGTTALLVLLVTAVLAQATPEPTAFERDCEKLVANQRADSERLHDLLKLDWDHTMHESPEFATEVGYPGLNDRWTDNSPAAIARRERELQAPLKVIQSLNRTNLSAVDQLNYDLFKRGIDQAVEEIPFHSEYLQLNQMGGVQQDSAQILEIAPRATVKDYENILARLNALPALIDQTIALMQKGLEIGKAHV